MAEAQRFVILPKHLRKKLPKECQTGCRWKWPSSVSSNNPYKKERLFIMSTNSSRLAARSKLKACAFAALAVASMVVGNVGTATAAKPRPPRPTPIPAPTATPAPVPTSVPAPVSFTVTDNVPDHFAVQMAPATQLGNAELLSGPTIGGPAIVLVGDGGRVSFLRLAENSDYVFRYRNNIPNGSTVVSSDWVTFSFRTPTFDSLRPAAPQNLRVVEQTATSITVRWDPVPDAPFYNFSLNGGAPVKTGVCSGVYCTPPDPLTATFPRPTAGSVLFSVTASRPGTTCSPYCFPDNRFNTSFPATLVISN